MAAKNGAGWLSAPAFVKGAMPLGSFLRSLVAPPVSVSGKVLVAFASQTGAAEQIAWKSAGALNARGDFVRVAALGALTPAELAQAGTLLVVASTYGSGEPPDSARSFMRKWMTAPVALKGIGFAVLALGDRAHADFCGFGRMLDRWLAASRAKRLFEPVLVDGDADFAAMRQWCDNLTRLGADTDVDALMPAPPRDWVLAARRLLNPGSPGGEAFHVALTPPDPALLNWTAGDIAEVWPRNPEAAVEEFLSTRGLDGAARFDWHHRRMALRDILAHSRLPAPHEAAGLSPQQMVLQLQAFAHREYSIASLPDGGAMELLVRKAVRGNGRLGLGSGWLAHHAAIGGLVPLRLRPNPNFHPPGGARAAAPAILIGAGTGMAGLRAHLKHRRKQGWRRAWLLFGERSGAYDLLYREDIEAWQADGTLERLDLAFSRDAAPKRYVQHLVAEHASAIRAWVMEQGAFLLVCGGIGMAAGVEEVLTTILGAEMLEQMTRDGSYRRDIY
jgi:sulfite reductase (NADPH) flavoprotein alpha-component